MVRNVSTLFMAALMFLVQATASYAVDQTRVFQQGLNGYAGVRDTWVSMADWDTPKQHTVNYGQNENLILSRDGGENPLLRFDLSAIPANSAIRSATLSLYNITHSSYSGTRDFIRRIRLFTVLRDWDEGNQVNSPIDAAGKHGATGDHAFDYFTGEGTDVAWGERGMAAGTDYASIPESFCDVVNEGWYTWDVTKSVEAWIKGKQANYGVVLRDATGYEDDHLDDRTFVSSQGTTHTDRRPKLTVVYNPDTPLADAGPDQENLSWDGAPVTLDGSGSHDRPGGDDASLTYSWRVLTAAYGSSMNGAVLPGAATAAFTPDLPGEWDIELTVTNNMGEIATDTVHLRLLKIPASHPRIYLTPAKLADLKARAVPTNPRWTQLKEEADDDGGEMHAKALVYQITQEASYCSEAIDLALNLIADPDDWSTKAGDIALVYDYCHSLLSSEQQTTFINYFNTWGDDKPKGEDVPGWGNYWPRYGYSYALIGLTTYGDNPRAAEWLDEYRHRRYRDHDLSLLDYIAPGGAWPEGTVYDWIANWPRVKALEAWRTATGENLFESTPWFRNRLSYSLLHQWPGVGDAWGYAYHPYPSTGDAERNRGSMTNYGRIMSLILTERFPNESVTPQLQAYLATPPTNFSMDFLSHEEFLWFNPDAIAAQPSVLTHYAPATGTLFMRSDWPDGAADTNPDAAYATFQCGDHFTYHQHYDQNSFTLFKNGDLLLDSGVYSGDGLSHHDINYYVRTIAHNTLIVYNPNEDFSSARPDASSNDGGQRSLYPASRSPETLDYFQHYITQYDTGDMLRFEDSTYYTYALGDATKAYNNPVYNQTMDTSLSGNTAKVSRFQREFVYLRPETSGGSNYLVVYDRVGVTQPAFSGENTKLLFHTLNEPTVNGASSNVSPGETLYANADSASAVSGESKVFLEFLLPAQRNVRKVGGRGIKAFWVFDANYDWHWNVNEPQPRPVNDFEEIPYGEWRLELEPADTALEHNFLTVLHPADAGAAAMPPATLITPASGIEGVHIADGALNRVVLFSSATDGSAPVGTLTYSYRPTARTLNVLFDLTPETRYRLDTTLDNGTQTVTLTPDANGSLRVSTQGVLYFMVQAGLLNLSIDLNAGWNLISTPFSLTDPAIARALDSIKGDYTVVWGFWNNRWWMYSPGNPALNDLNTLDAGRGYWIRMTQPRTLTFQGTAADKTIPIRSGWNLVGYNGTQSYSPDVALQSIEGQLEILWTYENEDWFMYDPDPAVADTLTVMDAGRGYWIRANADHPWTLP